MSLRPHQPGDVSDALHVLPLHFSTRRETNEHGNGPVLVARAVAPTNVPARAVAFIISYQSEKYTSMQCHGQLRHEVTKQAIKAASKLCMHVICYMSHI